MSEEELSNLPVQRICDKHSVLFLWSTAPFLDAAFRLINAWGFKYKTVWKVWRKIYRNGEPRVGCGHWVRGNCEFLLVAARGSPLKLFQQHKKEKQEYVAPITVHSEKPREIRDLIQKFLKAPNKIELFAREIVPGWSAWGLEVPGCYHIDPSISKEKIQEEGEDEEDFQLQEEHEFLTIYPKDTLKIIEKFENGWWVGELNDGTMGVFPGPKDVDESKPLPFIIVRPSKE
jgi:N6-adenosine-specific RNA methylase IME4